MKGESRKGKMTITPTSQAVERIRDLTYALANMTLPEGHRLAEILNETINGITIGNHDHYGAYWTEKDIPLIRAIIKYVE